MDAKLIRTGPNGAELRQAETGRETWPGYDDSFPLSVPGYWMGTDLKHWHVGESEKIALREFKGYFEEAGE